MRQPAQIGQPQARQGLAAAAPGRGERAEIAVCEGQHDKVGRGLAEILGHRGFLKSMPFPQQDVHALPCQYGSDRGVIKAAFADHDDARAALFVGAPRTVELRAHPGADALHQQPHRLAGNRDVALGAQHIVVARDGFDSG